MPKRIRIRCEVCKKVIAERKGDKFYILRKTYGEPAYTEITVKHDTGGYVKIKCHECEKSSGFRSTDIARGLSYCVAPKKSTKK